MTEIAFYILSGLAIATALMVVLSKSPVHSVLYLIVTFFAIAGHYLLLNAQFLAAVHVIVYAGAIMVLFLYVIMMLNLNKESEPHKPVWIKFAAVIAGGMLLVTLIGSLRAAEALPPATNVDVTIGSVERLGMALFNEFLIPFEVSSILLLAAMVGAVMLGKREIK
jgi:NADH-quinone oxidoreductase subunit J